MTLRLLLDSSRQLGRFARPVKLATEAAAANDNGAVWVQVAAEGEFKGHPAGPFTLTEAVFDQVIGNFRSHPSYAAGPEGMGASRVVAWDFHHKSETDDPSIAIQGAPAQGWVLELEKRKGPGGWQLWALTEWLEPARSYVQQGKYQWASIAVWPESVDPKTGEAIGWYLSSVALTNDPFIQGMAPLAASHRRGRKGRTLEMPEAIEHALEELHWIFGLPELATLAEITAELAKLRAMATGTMAPPPGVDVSSLLNRLRRMLNLPTLATDAETLAEVDKLMAAIAAAAAAPPPPVQPPPPAPAPPPVAADSKRTRTMSLLLEIAKLRKLPTVTTEEEAKDAILAAMSKGEAAESQLRSILQALGHEDVDGAVAKIAELLAKAKQLQDALPAIAGLKAKAASTEEEVEEAEVDQAIAAHRLPAEIKPALMFMRSGGVAFNKDDDDAKWADVAAKKKLARESFLKAYPLPEPGQGHLLDAVATHRGVDQPHSPWLRSLEIGADGRVRTPAAPPPAPTNGPRGILAEVEACPGANITLKAMNYLRGKAGGDKLTHEECHEQASQLLSSLRSGGRAA